jgi:Tlde1 domain
MALDSASGEHEHYRDGGPRRRRACNAPVFAGREYGQIVRIFVVSLGIGFALTGAAAWAVATAPSDAPTLRAETQAQAEQIGRATSGSAAADVRDVPFLSAQPVAWQHFELPAVSAAAEDDALSSFARAPAQPGDEAASAQAALPGHTLSVPVPSGPTRTAVYDIASHTVYLPNGQTLEAHSGLGSKRDDPRYVEAKNRGPTPPNVYQLKLREKLFHKVRAIRLIPVDESGMFGRDGMLAHTYMLGANGQSNGCVSFKNYSEFLQAYLKGEVDRLVVVPRIDPATWHTAGAEIGPQLLDTD